MAKTTRRDLDGVCETIKKETGGDYTIGYTSGVPRLYRDNESREVSPRLPIAQMYDWLWAYLDGIRVGHTIGYNGGYEAGRYGEGKDMAQGGQ